jgi:pseudomonalisin
VVASVLLVGTHRAGAASGSQGRLIVHRFAVRSRDGRRLRAALALAAGSACAVLGGGAGAPAAAGTLPPLLGAPTPGAPGMGAPRSGGVQSAPVPGAPALRLLTANVLPGLALLPGAGAPDPATVVHLGVGLADPDPAGEAAMLHAVDDPSSPLFHHFLTPAQLAQRFGEPPGVVDRVTSWLGGGGLTVTHVAATGDFLQATGTVAQVERLLRTRLERFTSRGQTFVANRVAPSVPAGLPVISVIGLNSLQRFHTFHGVRAQPAAGVAASRLRTGQLSPQDLWNVYHQPAENLGQGSTMAILGDGQVETVIADLRTFEHLHGFPAMLIRVHDVGAGPHDDSSGTAEWDLDTQASTGMAPLARREDLYFTSSLADADVATDISAWVSDPQGPLQASASFGECETGPLNPVISNPALDPVNPDQNPKAQYGTELGNNLQPVAEQILAQGVLQGKTLFVSTGDTGSSCPALVLPAISAGNGVVNQAVPLTNYPASSGFAVGVGGTVLYTDGAAPRPRRSVEYAWPFTGGGSTLLIPAPEWQRATRGNALPCLVDSGGSPSNTGRPCRGIPDVTAVSGDAVSNGYTVIVNGRDVSGGGTSLSSPLWLGMWARIQAASPRPDGNGFANPALYSLGNDPGRAARDFHDITVGANGTYVAGPGWDYVSGFGSPDVTNLMIDLDGRTQPVAASTSALTPPPQNALPPPEGVAAVTDQVGALLGLVPTPSGGLARAAAPSPGAAPPSPAVARLAGRPAGPILPLVLVAMAVGVGGLRRLCSPRRDRGQRSDAWTATSSGES